MRAVSAPPSSVSSHQPSATDYVGDAAERELVAAVIRKDRKATAEFVERFADPVHAYVRMRLAPHGELVDDLVQEVFLAALKGLPSFAGRASLKSWLLVLPVTRSRTTTGRISDGRKSSWILTTTRRVFRLTSRVSTK